MKSKYKEEQDENPGHKRLVCPDGMITQHMISWVTPVLEEHNDRENRLVEWAKHLVSATPEEIMDMEKRWQ